MTEIKLRPGLVTGVMLVACLAAQAGCAPTPVTRTVATEQVTTTTPPPPPPQQVITTTTENVATPEYRDTGRSVATAHRQSARDDDVDEETTETIVPVVPARSQTITRTTIHSTTQN